MDFSKLSPDKVEQLYNAGSFFVLNGLPTASHFAIDGRASLTAARFQGLKLVPPGFHLITFVPGPRCEPGKPTSATHIGQQIQRGLLRFFKPQEIVIKSYDESEESLHQPEAHEPEAEITSRSYMKSLDSALAPYPIERYSSWKCLTSHIHPDLVNRVFGLSSSNEATIDSLLCNEETSGTPGKSGQSGQQACPDPRSEQHPTQSTTSPFPNSGLRAGESHTSKASCTHWPTIDLKRSWPKDCVGEELTRWSRDKSWLFHQFILNHCQKDLNSFLGLIQLSFLTFFHVHSFQSLESYQALLTLLSRSTIQELSNFDQRYPALLVQVVIQLGFQLEELDADFFVDMQDPQLENWLFKTLSLLRIQLNYVISHGEQELVKEMMEQRWPALQSTCKRFDWNVRPLRQDRQDVESEDEDDSDSDETSEDDDDKPVVIETEL